MRVLIGCELSGVVRRAFRARGHDAWSCDIYPCDDGDDHHYQADVMTVLDFGWDLAIFHPPCTYMSVSGLHWNKNNPVRARKTDEAVEFARRLLDAPIERIALENPISCLSTRIRKPDQIIQPWMFGDDASKATCLWLKNLPLLVHNPECYYPPRLVQTRDGGCLRRWSNQTDSGQNRLGPSPTRAKERSQTYQGIANAFADQWGSL
ncbi:MAG: hypothetical protein KGL39_50500 [Patescibacteria group bacterium]|nr:hypothetical protein [Patescibacteria group bacterium]